MKIEKLLLLVFIVTCNISYAQKIKGEGNKEIIIIVDNKSASEDKRFASFKSAVNPTDLRWVTYDVVAVASAPLTVTMEEESGKVDGDWKDRLVKWSVSAKKVLLLNAPILGASYFANPGDSVRIAYGKEKTVFSGRGAVAFELQDKLMQVLSRFRPSVNIELKSVKNYYEWLKCCDDQMDATISLLEDYQDNIPKQQFDLIKLSYICHIESNRVELFERLYGYSSVPGQEKTKPRLGLQGISSLISIWDSTQASSVWGKWLRKLPAYYGSSTYLYSYNRQATRRKFNFDFSIDSLYLKPLRVQAYYNEAKKVYTGLQLQKLLTRILAEETITELGPLDNVTLRLLKDYYSIKGYPKFRHWIEQYYKASLAIRKGKKAPSFNLMSKEQKIYNSDHLRGKVAVIYFWNNDCTGCERALPVLKKIQKLFVSDSNVVFLSVSVEKDKEKWDKGLRDQQAIFPGTTELYTAGEGIEHPMIKRYMISSFPSLVMIDAEGGIPQIDIPNPVDSKSEAEFYRLIAKESIKAAKKDYEIKNDGPYVIYKNGSRVAYRISNGIAGSVALNGNLKVNTDIPELFFNVKLKSNLQEEECKYAQPDSLIAISDIEGNFDSFRLLLQKNKVIDNEFNWTFGKGHLVITGDVFDRGRQVTECLWLIYSLEEKALAAGGKVHFILGNHEIMNLNNDTRYVQKKYIENAALLGLKYNDLFSRSSELGKWLLTKNIVERIGDLLFVHGGISTEVLEMSISLEDINTLARKNYVIKSDSSDARISVLFNGKTSPFWYRGYFDDASDSKREEVKSELEKALHQFQVKKVIVGHTIIDKEHISMHYNGMLVNLDTHHASGNSEGLLSAGGSYFRINKNGEGFILENDHEF